MRRRIVVKSEAEIERMRPACQIAAQILDDVVRACAPGVTTADLDQFARARMKELGATSAFFGYRGFPGHICTSVNDEVVHGIPGMRRIRAGDVVSIDVGVSYEGWIGDNARSVLVGVQDPELVRLLRTTELALQAGIRKAVSGARVGDISHAVENVILAAGFSVVKEFVGHGVGRSMHEEPQIPNFGKGGQGPRLRSGMTLAIEPMVNLGVEKVEVMADGWTVLTADRKPSAHFEHTVLVRDGAPEILTWKKTS